MKALSVCMLLLCLGNVTNAGVVLPFGFFSNTMVDQSNLDLGSTLVLKKLILQVMQHAMGLLDVRLSVGPPASHEAAPSGCDPSTLQRRPDAEQKHNVLDVLHLGRFLSNFGSRLGAMSSHLLKPAFLRSDTYPPPTAVQTQDELGAGPTPSAVDVQTEVLTALSEAIADEIAIALHSAEALALKPPVLRVTSLRPQELMTALKVDEAVARELSEIYQGLADNTLTPRDGFHAFMTSQVLDGNIARQLSNLRLRPDTVGKEGLNSIVSFETLLARAVDPLKAASPELDMLLQLFGGRQQPRPPPSTHATVESGINQLPSSERSEGHTNAAAGLRGSPT